MMNIEKQRERFRNHVAKFTDYGNIKILDFKRPDSSEYRIRFLFEEDYHRLHISGDLGELIATNYNNMIYEKFGDFVHNTGYFEEKVNCMSRKIYVYDEEKARADLTEWMEDCGIEAEDLYPSYDDMSEFFDDVLEDFSQYEGIGSKGLDILGEYIDDAWERAGDVGKQDTGILKLYMLAFELAQKQLKK